MDANGLGQTIELGYPRRRFFLFLMKEDFIIEILQTRLEKELQ